MGNFVTVCNSVSQRENHNIKNIKYIVFKKSKKKTTPQKNNITKK